MSSSNSCSAVAHRSSSSPTWALLPRIGSIVGRVQHPAEVGPRAKDFEVVAADPRAAGVHRAAFLTQGLNANGEETSALGGNPCKARRAFKLF